jgi:hypothetical protein
MTYQSKKAGIWQTTLILPFYDIPIKESRYLANNSNITIHGTIILELFARYLLSLIGMS